jgi:hypothetical protein
MLCGTIDLLLAYNSHSGGPPPLPLTFPVPPGIIFPPRPWPPITIGFDLKPTYLEPGEDENPCETTTAADCTTTTSILPETTSTITNCFTVTGCEAIETNTETTTEACVLARAVPTLTGTAQSEATSGLSKRANSDCGKWGTVFPIDNANEL